MADNKIEPKAAVPEAPITMKDVVALIPSMIASAVAAATKSNVPAAKPGSINHPKCTDCRQVRDNGAGGGCQGRHIEMVVFPQRYPQHADYFPGAIINGIRYLSNDSGHRILVPADAEATILGLVGGFEQNEQDMAVGRKREHHSGRVSPNGSSTVPAVAAWR